MRENGAMRKCEPIKHNYDWRGSPRVYLGPVTVTTLLCQSPPVFTKNNNKSLQYVWARLWGTIALVSVRV